MRKSNDSDESSPLIKLGFTFMIILLVFIGNIFVTSSLPQHILVNQDSMFEFNNNILTFENTSINGSSITLNGESFYVENRDVITMGQRNSIKLTGRAVSVSDEIFYSADLTIPTKLNHVILFENPPLVFKDDLEAIKIKFGEQCVHFSIVDQVNHIYEIDTHTNKYNIELAPGDTTYITDDENMGLYKFSHKDDTIEISVVGYYGKQQISFTSFEEVC